MDLKTRLQTEGELLGNSDSTNGATNAVAESTAVGRSASSVTPSANWQEARQAYPIYSALAKQLRMGALPFENSLAVPENPSPEIRTHVLQWLDQVDSNAKAYQIRQLPLSIFNDSEPALRALIQRHLRKNAKSDADRDKIDFLLVQYFALCAPDWMYHQEITPQDVKKVLEPIVPGAEVRTPQWCEALETIIDHLKNADSLRALLQTGYLKEARSLKESSGEKFYQPEALLTFTRFNFLMRRNFIRLQHCDQRAIAQSLDQLEKAGVQNINCMRSGLSNAEPLAKILQISQSWRPQSHLDYGEGVVIRSFEQLLALRGDLEDALAKTPSQPQLVPAANETTAAKPSVQPSVQATAQTSPVTANQNGASAQSAVSAASSAASPTQGCLDRQECEKTITDQLRSSPATASRPMCTVTLQGSKLLLSSWELTAFHSGADGEPANVRKAVVARAALALAIDEFKKSSASAPLKAAIEAARADVTYFQKVIENAKNDRNIEAAVNLNISVKRLSAFLSEAEKLVGS